VPIPALHSRHWCRANDPAKPGRWPDTNDVGACRGQFRFSWLFVTLITIGDEANEFINPNPNTHTGYPGFPRAVGLGTAGDRWRATTVRELGETVEKETAGTTAISGETARCYPSTLLLIIITCVLCYFSWACVVGDYCL